MSAHLLYRFIYSRYRQCQQTDRPTTHLSFHITNHEPKHNIFYDNHASLCFWNQFRTIRGRVIAIQPFTIWVLSAILDWTVSVNRF